MIKTHNTRQKGNMPNLQEEVAKAVNAAIDAATETLKQHLTATLSSMFNTRFDKIEADVQSIKADLEKGPPGIVGPIGLQNVNDTTIDLKIQMDDLEQYSRRDNVKISGLVPEKENESMDDLENSILKLAADMDCNITKESISVAHRLKHENNGVKVVIVKFNTRKDKEAFYKAKKNLKGNKTYENLYITEDLTVMRYKMLRQCKNCPNFKSLTTVRAKILVWLKGSDAPIYVTHPKDLLKLKLKPDLSALGLINE